MEEQLKAIFANVNDWLKFAEAKNAAIIAADAAAAFGALTILLSKDNNLATWLYLYLHCFVFCISCSAIGALLSVVPKTKIFFSGAYDKKRSNDNLLFYGDVAKYSPEEYLSALSQRQGEPESATGLDLDYAQQIVINSRITLTKYAWFRISIWFALAAVVTPILTILLFFLIRQKNPDTTGSRRRRSGGRS